MQENLMNENRATNLVAPVSPNKGHLSLLELSVAHLDEKTAAALMSEGIDGTISYPKVPYGVFLHVSHVKEAADEAPQLPPALAACLKYAREQGAHWIMFDVDADLVDALPVAAREPNWYALEVVEA